MCRSKRVEKLRNSGIINSTTWSHLVGYFYKIYVMMHGSMNIKFSSDFGFGRKLDTYFGGKVQPSEAFLLRNCVLYIFAYLCGPGTDSIHPSFLPFSLQFMYG